MASIENQIREAASRNAELLQILAQTEYAPPEMKQQEAYIKQVEDAISRNNAALKKLGVQRAKELSDHKKYSESVTRRFLFKATGQKEKFEAKADKEEKEYFEALRAEHHAQEEATQLSTQLGEAQQRKSQLQSDLSRHQQAQKDLDSLYQSIFAGPSPSFPEEDQQENAVQEAINEYQRLEGMLKAEEQVLHLLTMASKAMGAAIQNVEMALRHSRMDMFGGGAISDMMERSALSRAEVATAELYRTVAQAQSLSPHVQPLPPVAIAQGSLMTDVLFDNVFTDMAFHEKIKDSAAGLQRAAGVLQQNQASTQQRRSDLGQYTSHASGRLADERGKLQKVREQIFERTVQGGGASKFEYGAPPAYT